ncbi:MFS transporter [Paraburkholderia dilworthii]|uniref:MFS transporter n=1 Tax=Paraburkholderia dilworthii TaxID=948106 RepID=UPI0004824558|nr:MFS transporter [Paraburkholderia dilworthii]
MELDAASIAPRSYSEQTAPPSLVLLERLDRLPATPYLWKLVALLGIGFFFEAYDILYAAYIAPAMVRSGVFTMSTGSWFGLSGVAAFISSLFAGLFVGTMFCGFLADKFGRRAIFTYSLLVYAISTAFIAFQDTAAGMNFWRFVAGTGLGVEMVTIGAYVSEFVPRTVRGRAFALVQAIGFLAVPGAAFLALWLVPLAPLGLEGWRWVVLAGGIGAIFAWFLRRALPESPRWLLQKGRVKEAQAVVEMIERHVSSKSKAPLSAQVSDSDARTATLKAATTTFPRGTLVKRAVILSIYNIFSTVGYYGFASWVPNLLVKQGVPVASSMLYSGVIALAAPVGPAIGLLLADRIERRTQLAAVAVLIAISGIIFSQTRAPALLIGMGVLITVASNTMTYCLHTYQAELFPTSVRARAVGFVYSWSRITAIFVPFCIAWILSNDGPSGVFLFVLISEAICVIAILFGPKTANRSLELLSERGINSTGTKE